MDEVMARRSESSPLRRLPELWARSFAAIKRAFEDMRTRRRLRRELRDLADAGLIESIMRPFGLSPFGATRLVQAYPAAMRRFARMTRWLGLAAKLPQPAGISDMSAPHRRCVFCRAAGLCERWLRGDAGSSEPAQFCPNSDAFERARR